MQVKRNLVIKLSTTIIYQIQLLASIDILLTFSKVSLTIINLLLLIINTRILDSYLCCNFEYSSAISAPNLALL